MPLGEATAGSVQAKLEESDGIKRNRFWVMLYLVNRVMINRTPDNSV